MTPTSEEWRREFTKKLRQPRPMREPQNTQNSDLHSMQKYQESRLRTDVSLIGSTQIGITRKMVNIFTSVRRINSSVKSIMSIVTTVRK